MSINGTQITAFTSFAQALAYADNLLQNYFVQFRGTMGPWEDSSFQIDGVSTHSSPRGTRCWKVHSW